MQVRVDDRLQLTITADDSARRALLPPLLLQPLVENAVLHGLEPKLQDGTVQAWPCAMHANNGIEAAQHIAELLPDLTLFGHPHARPHRAGSGARNRRPDARGFRHRVR